MVKHPWPLLEISLSDFRRLATLNIIPTYLPITAFRKLFQIESKAAMSRCGDVEMLASIQKRVFPLQGWSGG